MTIITDLDFFDTVFLKNDPEQMEGFVIGIEICPSDNGQYSSRYLIQWNGSFTRHYWQELSKEKDESKV